MNVPQEVLLEQGRLLSELGTPASVLYLIVSSRFGALIDPDNPAQDPIDPLELQLLVKETWSVTVPDGNWNKIMACLTSVTTDAFFEDPMAFAGGCNAIASGDIGDIVDGYLQPPDLDEMLWAKEEVELLWAGEDRPDYAPTVKEIMKLVVMDAASDENEDPIGDILVELAQLRRETYQRAGFQPAYLERALVLAANRASEPAERSDAALQQPVA